jgi:hypothetical protein
MRIGLRTLLALTIAVGVLGSCAVAEAQNACLTTSQTTFTPNPTRGCVVVNLAEHNEVDPVTQAARITRYDLLFYDEAVDPTNAANAPIQTSPLGKPPVDAAGIFYFGQGAPTPLPTYPAGRRLKALVVAVGPGGSSPRVVGAVSNPFGRSNPVTAPAAPPSVRMVPE